MGEDALTLTRQQVYTRSYLAKIKREVFYVITHSAAPGTCKPGVSGWLTKRQQSLQGAFPFGDIKLEYVFVTKSRRYIEKLVHARFRQHKLNGDWFAVSPEDVIAFVQSIPLVGDIDAEEDHRVVPHHVE